MITLHFHLQPQYKYELFHVELLIIIALSLTVWPYWKFWINRNILKRPINCQFKGEAAPFLKKFADFNEVLSQRKYKSLCYSEQKVRFRKLMKFADFFLTSLSHPSFALNVKCVLFSNHLHHCKLSQRWTSVYTKSVNLIGLLKLGIPCAIDLPTPENSLPVLYLHRRTQFSSW